MRSLPIALVTLGDVEKFVRDSFFNALITHGHPRAIVGSILFGFAVRRILISREAGFDPATLEEISAALDSTKSVVTNSPTIRAWTSHWDQNGGSRKGAFLRAYVECLDEARSFLRAMPDFSNKTPIEYYRLLGALNPVTKGSGLSTVCAAIYLYMKEHHDPEKALFTAVNILGSDTDTIANFLGALLGADRGTDAVPISLAEGLQDRDYLMKTAERLCAVATGRPTDYSATDTPIKRDDAYLRMLAWEIGLHEMFWDAIDEGGVIVHPALGRGRITGKRVEKLRRQGYVAKLLHVNFECGQTCTFHSRVENNEKVFGSFSTDLERSLKSWTSSAARSSTQLIEAELEKVSP